MQLTTPRAIVLAALLLAGAIAGMTAFPRYQIQRIDGSTAFARIDRWTGTIAITALGGATAPAQWVTLEQQSVAVPDPFLAALQSVRGESRQLRASSVAFTVVLAAVMGIAFTALAFGLQRVVRRQKVG